MSFMAAQVLWLTGTPAMDRARGVDGIFSPRSGLLVRCSEYWKSTDRCRVAENRADFESPKFPLKSKAQISDGPGGGSLSCAERDFPVKSMHYYRSK
jgi:hypothetical protein